MSDWLEHEALHSHNVGMCVPMQSLLLCVLLMKDDDSEVEQQRSRSRKQEKEMKRLEQEKRRQEQEIQDLRSTLQEQVTILYMLQSVSSPGHYMVSKTLYEVHWSKTRYMVSDNPMYCPKSIRLPI